MNCPTAPPEPTSPPTSAPASPGPRWPSACSTATARRSATARRTTRVGSGTWRLPLADGEAVEIVTAKAGDGDALKLLRHDVAHVLAESVLELYPGTKVSIGPPIADGFYYDFEFPDGVSINEGDFERIEAQMRKHIKADEPFERSEVTAGEAIERYLKEDQPYKVELIEDLVRMPTPPTPWRPSACIATASSSTSAVARMRPAPAARRRSS